MAGSGLGLRQQHVCTRLSGRGLGANTFTHATANTTHTACCCTDHQVSVLRLRANAILRLRALYETGRGQEGHSMLLLLLLSLRAPPRPSCSLGWHDGSRSKVVRRD